jgi:hypothetical protein
MDIEERMLAHRWQVANGSPLEFVMQNLRDPLNNAIIILHNEVEHLIIDEVTFVPRLINLNNAEPPSHIFNRMNIQIRGRVQNRPYHG